MAKRDKGLRLHKEHGVNTTIPICSWCSKPKNQIVLLGATYKDKAPMHMIVDREPCDDCKAKMALGITLCETTADGKSTGRWCVVREEAVINMLGDTPLARGLLRDRGTTISVEAAKQLGLFDNPAIVTEK